METEPSVESQVEQVYPPEVGVLLQLLDEIGDDWSGYGVKLRIKTMINERLLSGL